MNHICVPGKMAFEDHFPGIRKMIFFLCKKGLGGHLGGHLGGQKHLRKNEMFSLGGHLGGHI